MFWQIAQGREAVVSDKTVVDLGPRAQPNSVAVRVIDLSSSTVRAIGLICGGWILIELLVVLVGQTATSAEDTATFISLSFGAGSLALAFVLQLRRTVNEAYGVVVGGRLVAGFDRRSADRRSCSNRLELVVRRRGWNLWRNQRLGRVARNTERATLAICRDRRNLAAGQCHRQRLCLGDSDRQAVSGLEYGVGYERMERERLVAGA